MVRNINKLALTLILVICLLPLSSRISYAAQTSNGRISGQLLNGSRSKAPLSNQKVTLQMAQGDSARDLTTATTDAHGTYTFDHLSTDKTIKYALYIRYQGAQYTSDLVSLDSKPQQQVNLTVYDATTNSSNIAIVQNSVLIHEPDAGKNTLSISEVFVFRNLDNHTYVGSLNASKGKPNALLFSLPPHVSHITLNTGFDGYQTITVDRGFATDAALPPGPSEFAFTFEVPYTASDYDFRYVATLPTVSLTIMVPTALHASSATLNSQGVVTASDQRAYQQYKANGLLKSQEVHLQLEGLPYTAPPNTSSTVNTTLIWLIVSLLLMLAIICITLVLYRSHKQQTTANVKRSRKGMGKATEKSATTSAAAKKIEQTSRKSEQKQEPTASSARQQALLHELLELDKSYESGKLSKAVYQERRAKTKARLRTLLSEEQEATRR